MNPETKQFRIGLIALLIISLHIVLCLYLLFAPAKFRIQSGMIGVYRQLVLLGPFFTESRITSTRYLSIRYKHDSAWSSFRNLSEDHFAAYRESPWRWDKLAFNSYQTDLILTLGKMAKGRSLEEIKNSASFKELSGYLSQEFIPSHVDSVQVIGHGVSYLPRSRTFLPDTSFAFTYNPHTAGGEKK